MRTLLLCCALALGGCQTIDRHSALPPVTAKIPQSLRQACAGTVNIPDRDLTAGEVSRLWAKDRRALGACMRRHGALVKAVSVLEGSR
jgi:hypothetical protein